MPVDASPLLAPDDHLFVRSQVALSDETSLVLWQGSEDFRWLDGDGALEACLIRVFLFESLLVAEAPSVELQLVEALLLSLLVVFG